MNKSVTRPLTTAFARRSYQIDVRRPLFGRRTLLNRDQVVATFFAGGGDQLPSMIEGDFAFGQYNRIIRMNLPAGAGSQFDSLSAPGESFWM